MAKTVYVLWGQYHDRSGHNFAGVYESEDEAQAGKELIDKYGPSMDVKIEALPYVPIAKRSDQ